MFLVNGNMFLVNGNMFLVNGNMFLVNGNMFLVNVKPFINKSHISCGFLKHAWCIFKATLVRNNILPLHQNNLLKEENKMYGQSPCTLINEFFHRLFCETKIPRSLITQQEFFPVFEGLVS